MTAELLMAAVYAASAAVTASCSVAAGTGDWGPVQAAGTIAKKARLNMGAALLADIRKQVVR